MLDAVRLAATILPHPRWFCTEAWILCHPTLPPHALLTPAPLPPHFRPTSAQLLDYDRSIGVWSDMRWGVFIFMGIMAVLAQVLPSPRRKTKDASATNGESKKAK